jgi:DNA repair exonuclease SbcCD ATPase subunit
MKLKLKNFRCYLDKEFDFGEHGLLLLSGPSGTGKSSILLAINFVLYGTGSKLITYGKSSCKVELEFEDFHIVRTKRPNRVVLNGVHEDATAQAMINKKFGKTFDVTGYIAQNALNSFVMMSPIVKLAFLEKFAFADADLGALKAKVRAVIKKRNEQLIVTTSQYEMAANVLEEMEEPEEVPYPLKPSKNREKSMKNETIRHKNSMTLIKRAQKSLEKQRRELEALRILDAKTKVKSSALNNAIEKLDDLSTESKEITYEGDEVLELYEEQLVAIVSHRELILLEQRYEEDEKRFEEMKETEIRESEQKMEEIDANLWKEYSQSEVKSMIADYKQLSKDLTELESLQERLDNCNASPEKLQKNKDDLKINKAELKKKEDLLAKLELQQELFTCPSCATTLKIHDDQLRIADDVEVDEADLDLVRSEVSSLRKLVSRLEYSIPQEQNRVDRHHQLSLKIQGIKDQYDDELPTLSEVDNDLEDLRDYRRSQNALEKQKKSLEKSMEDEKFSSTVSSFEDSLKKQRKKIKSLKKKLGDGDVGEMDEQELRVKIQIQKRNKERMEEINRSLTVRKAEKSTYQTDILRDKEEHIQEFKKIRELDDVRDAMEKRKNEIISLQKKADMHADNVEKIEEYKTYLHEAQKYQHWVEKVADLEEKEKKDRKRYGAATTLKEKILEAESIAMINVINSINAHVQEYLDLFFNVDPISARLLPFKESKKSTKKPQVNIQIEYKGMEADLNMLSGGELSRVVLAYTLALGEIFNTPLMLLDECTASLDQDLTSVVIEGIRENYPDKMVIVIAHQCVSGIFDREISL